MCTIAILFGVLYIALPSEVSIFADERAALNTPLYSLAAKSDKSATALKNHSAYSSGQYTARLKILGLLPVKTVTIDVIERQEIILGGQTFGIRLYTKGVIVVGCGNFIYQGKSVNPAYEAGIRIGDRLIDADGQTLHSNEQLLQIVSQNQNRPIKFRVVRKNMEFEATVTPIIPDSESKYRLGLWVRDSTAGIGTLTYYNRSTGNLAGLGHAVADVDTGELMPSAEGMICKSDITEIIKGSKGEAGQLSGNFLNENYGELLANTEEGIFAKCKTTEFENEKTVPIALKNEIKVGAAQIYTQLDGQSPQYYDIKIEKIHNNLSENKNMVICVTDPDLLKKTGGIVQGMSGSPIVQDGKLIGAVTHVFVDDPTKGYGIFIEKMLITENELN